MDKNLLKIMLARSLEIKGERRVQKDDGTWANMSQDTVMRQCLTQLAADPEMTPEQTYDHIAKTWGNNPAEAEQVKTQLCAIRVELVHNFIMAESNFMASYFQIVTLADNEEPKIVAELQDGANEVRISYTSQDGTTDKVRVLTAGNVANPTLRVLTAATPRYKIRDVQKGNVVADMSRRTLDIARDLRVKMDTECRTLMNTSLALGGMFGAFSYEQANANRVTRIYLPHSNIVTGHLPTTNYYDMTQTAGSSTNPSEFGGLTRFGIKVLTAIVSYANKWGDVLPGGGRLVPTGEILVPASNIEELFNDNITTVNVASQRLQEEINSVGYAGFSFMGINWKFIADVTIPRGTCYPRFNQQPGRVFMKPTQDLEFTETNIMQNYEQRMQQKVFSPYIISQYRPRAMKIKFGAA